MKPDQYENNAEGILCVYKNPKWLVCIKNWKPDNDIAGIAHLEIHHSTDEQFILAAGKAILITQKDTKVIYVQDSNCSMENSDFADLTAAQIADIQERARKILAE